jgi:stage II sporulation protein AA (anti-sigma F factor antagonist)
MLSHTMKGDTLVIRLSGELDHHSAATVREEIDALIDENKQAKRLIFDMKGLIFMDSSGIGMIIGRYKRMAARGGTVAVRDPGKHVDRIFTMSGIYQIVERA